MVRSFGDDDKSKLLILRRNFARWHEVAKSGKRMTA